VRLHPRATAGAKPERELKGRGVRLHLLDLGGDIAGIALEATLGSGLGRPDNDLRQYRRTRIGRGLILLPTPQLVGPASVFELQIELDGLDFDPSDAGDLVARPRHHLSDRREARGSGASARSSTAASSISPAPPSPTPCLIGGGPYDQSHAERAMPFLDGSA
jgi:hypothetical protein